MKIKCVLNLYGFEKIIVTEEKHIRHLIAYVVPKPLKIKLGMAKEVCEAEQNIIRFELIDYDRTRGTAYYEVENK